MQRKPVILCVDDEENPLLLRQLVLQKAGYEVLIAHSAEEALQMLENTPIDLVLSDHLMPGTTGGELTQKIKSRDPNLPVILISGVNEVPPGASFADLFLSKVEGPDRLCQEVATVLSSAASR
jgi:CheY-like chemotaxis protein